MIEKSISKSRKDWIAYKTHILQKCERTNLYPDSFYGSSNITHFFSIRGRKVLGVKFLKERTLGKDSKSSGTQMDTLLYFMATVEELSMITSRDGTGFSYMRSWVQCIDLICDHGRDPASQMTDHQQCAQWDELAWGNAVDINTLVGSHQIILQQHDFGSMTVSNGNDIVKKILIGKQYLFQYFLETKAWNQEAWVRWPIGS